jgi:hypothetical protein
MAGLIGKSTKVDSISEKVPKIDMNFYELLSIGNPGGLNATSRMLTVF